MKKTTTLLMVSLLFLTGFGVLLYPPISNLLFQQNASQAIQAYSSGVKELDPFDREEQLRLAREYNDALTGTSIQDPFVPGSGVVLPDNYVSVINIGGVMASIEIPKINVFLPIRHGTSEDTLQTSVGHIEATAFPIGGEGYHCVLTAHRGLAEARLFTDLDLLEKGDVFLIHVMDETLCYQVNQVMIVEPEDTDALRPVSGEDYVTLITCHPYGVNSHRMLVRGERIPYVAGEMPQELLEKQVNWRSFIYVFFSVIWGIILVVYLITNRKKKARPPKRRW